MSFELTNLEYWEHLLVAEPWHIYIENLKFTNKHDIKTLKHFSMPSSWVCSLDVSKEECVVSEYEKKFPNGCKTTLYRKAKVEKFCKHREPSGINLRITKYDDYDHRESIIIVEMFSGRSDRLEKLKINHKVGTVLEYFEYGRKDSLKSIQYVKFAKPLWNGLTMKFYSISRLNNMISLSVAAKEMKCNFSNRDNRLLSYLVKFKSTSSSETIEAMKEHIETIGEKFAKQNRPNTIEIREFHENRILLTYHFEKGQIFQKKKLYWKGHHPAAKSEIAKCTADIEDMNNHETNELVELLRLEQQCSSEVLGLLQEADEIFQRRCLGREMLTAEGKSCTSETR